MADQDYRRLTRPQARFGFGVFTTSRSSLWLGKDHLLVIETTGYTETYKRFYFRDLHGVFLWTTSQWKIVALILAVLGGVFGVPALLAEEPIAAWIFGALSVLCLLGMTLDLMLGPTCRCRFRSAVQTEEMPSLNRLRRARKVLDQVRPLITAAQGALSSDQLAPRVQEPVAELIPNPTATQPNPQSTTGAPDPSQTPNPSIQ
jgi:hypothetical protein